MVPLEPGAPGAPGVPGAPVGPMGPVGPVGPIGPCGPGGPCTLGGLNVIPIHVDNQVAVVGRQHLDSPVNARLHDGRVVHDATLQGIENHCPGPRLTNLPGRDPADRLSER